MAGSRAFWKWAKSTPCLTRTVRGFSEDLAVVEPLGRDDHEVGPATQLVLELDHLGRDVREGGEFVHAVVDDHVFAEGARDHAGARGEDPVDRLDEAEAAHGPQNLEAQQLAIDDLDPIHPVDGDGQRIEHEDVGLDLADGLRRRPQLVDRAAQIRLGRRGRAVADRVDPQDAVVTRQDAHEVRLRERIAGEVMAETQHVSAAEGIGGNVVADGCA